MSTLPTLTGSQKQIDWANQIRAEKMAELEQFIAKAAEMKAQSKGTPEQIAAAQAQLDAAVAKLQGQTEAGLWIDWRGFSVLQLLKQMSR